jgi:hypothetical protein
MYKLRTYDRAREADIKAEARVGAFMTLRRAWKDRSASITAKELADSLGKDKGYVSRVLRGAIPTMTLETLAVFLEALGYSLEFRSKRFEDLPKPNWDASPSIVGPVMGRGSSLTVTFSPQSSASKTEFTGVGR